MRSAGAEDQGKSRTEASPVPSAAPAVPVPPSGATAVAVQAPTPAQDSELSTDLDWKISANELMRAHERIVDLQARGVKFAVERASRGGLAPMTEKISRGAYDQWLLMLDALDAETPAKALA